MQLGFASLLANIPSAICVAAAFWLCFHGRSGWGWFLVAAIALGASVKTKGGDKCE